MKNNGAPRVPSTVADIFRQAAELIANDPHRRGNLVHLDAPGRVVISGDIHGNRRNLTRILSHVSGGGQDRPTLILQEIIHGEPDPRSGCDRSVELMLRAVRAKIANPERVYFLMGNHDMAQIVGSEITKSGRGVCKSFVEGINFCFGSAAAAVLDAVLEFCRSLPLAVLFENGVQASHSLPSPDRTDLAGVDILNRPYQDGDFTRGGPAYEWTWGRNQTPEQLDELAEKLGVEFFVLGHRHLQSGVMTLSDRAVAINSDGPGGCVFEFSTDQTITGENAEHCIKPIVELQTGS